MIREQLLNNENAKPNSKEILKLREIFPQYFDVNGGFMMDRFKEMLSTDEVEVTKEGYDLRFLGKSYAKYLTSTDTTTVITPDEKHNLKDENKDSENIYIVGDNLDAIKHLLQSYSNKIKCIYIDPPYNTGTDGFVYPDDFKFTKESLAEAVGIEEDEAERILNMMGKSTHSAWLMFMYPRLMLARDLLSDDGIIFISIDDNEQANLKLLCDDIFGENNFVGNMVWKARVKPVNIGDAKYRPQNETEYVLVYEKSNINNKFYPLLTGSVRSYPFGLGERKYRLATILKSNRGVNYRSTMTFEINGYVPPEGQRWQAGFDEISRLFREGYIEFRDGTPSRRYFEDEEGDEHKPLYCFMENEWSSTSEAGKNELNNLLGDFHGFDTVKPTTLINTILKACTTNDDFVLDFFSGSATTSHSVMKINAEYNKNLKYILVQIPEIIKADKTAYKAGYRTIDQIGRTRIEKAAEKIYAETGANIDYGFKLYHLNEPNQQSLDKIVEFDPYSTLVLEDMTQDFAFNSVSGRETILTTWLNQDGYGLTCKPEKVKLETYNADCCKDSMYIIDPGLSTEDVMELIKNIENNTLDISRIVLYPYSVVFNVLHELKKNLTNLRNNKNVTVIERY